MKHDKDQDREAIGEASNPLGLEGLEFVEYMTNKPQALGQVLEAMGFRPVARHRSREVLLYKQGEMNIVVNAHDALPTTTPALSAFALRVRDAAAAYERALDRGAWPVPVEVRPMELHVPAIHGVGATRIYFVDRWREFSIWDVDFVPIPTVDRKPPALAGMHWFGLVQYIGAERTDDWTAFYRELLGWTAVPDEQRYGVMPSGRILKSPDDLMLQLVEPDRDAGDSNRSESLERLGFGVPDVLAAVRALRANGVDFVETERLHSQERGALSVPVLGGLSFELVQDAR
jgi:4-hydroxyphenylpyruvate dioxygenase